MKHLFSKAPLGLLLLSLCEPCVAQEWVKPVAGRSEYVQDRAACAQEAQLMALAAEAFDRDVVECLVSKGWQRNLSDKSMAVYCADKEAVISCKPGGTEEMYKKDRGECTDQMMKTVGNTYSRPGWSGLGGLIVSSIQGEENKTNLRKSQLQFMKICLEGKNWTVEYKGEAKALMEPTGSGSAPPTQQPAERGLSPAKGLPESPRASAALVAAEPAPPAAVVVAQVAVAAPRPTDFLALAVTTAKNSGCKLTGDVKMVSQSQGVSKFEAPCRGNKQPMKIICRNDDCKRDWIQIFPG